jgi:streptogramin lyase
VDVTKRFRADVWPGVESWYIISIDGRGDPIGIDSCGVVWLSDHDGSEIVRLASTFDRFIVELLDHAGIGAG